MSRKARNHVDDLRGASRLAIDATRGVTAVVEAMHTTIASGPALLGSPLAGPARLITGLAYGAVSGVTQLVGASIDLALAQLAPRVGAGAPGLEREIVVAALNGVLGDHLRAQGNPLAIDMRLRRGGEPLVLTPVGLRAAVPAATGRVLVLIHGSCMMDQQWTRRGVDHGELLARDLGYTPVYLHYNSGQHISTNGAELAGLLEQLVGAWPVPIDDLALLGHSMGGMVARSACRVGDERGHAWRTHLRTLITLGSPHHGAPLERGGNLLERAIGISRYSAPLARLGRIRSAGITDLRYGNVLDEHWQGRDRFAPTRDDRTPVPLPAGVRCYALAGTLSPTLAGDLRGDGLVPVASALGDHPIAALSLAFPADRRAIVPATGHMDLLDAPEVAATLSTWLA
jgi:pimeloyl-ACP methyl ester carboxylesterase